MQFINDLGVLLTQPILNSDTYKVTHWTFEHDNFERSYGYIEARSGGKFDRIQFFGLQYALRYYLSQQVTSAMIDEAEADLIAHGVPFNRAVWERIVSVHDGFLPVKIKALPEGTVVKEGTVLVTVESTDDACAGIAAYVETMLLRAVWYPTTIATRSRRWNKLIGEYLELSGTPDLVEFMMVDFGARGATSTESAAIGGMAHLVNFQVTDNLMGIRFAKHAYCTTAMPGFSIPACYDEQTEILTSNGFIPFREVTFDSLVGEYQEDGSLRFTKPTAIVNEPYEGDMIRFSTDSTTARIDALVTPNHRMIRRSVASGEIEVQEARNAIFSQKNEIPLSGVLEGDRRLTDRERLQIAFQADGSYVSRPDSYTGSVNGTYPIRFTLKKERKKKRLEALLARLEIPFTSYDGINDREGYRQYWCPLPMDWKMSKSIDWIDLSDKSALWARDFIEEICHWDGSRKGDCICYSSVDETSADAVQTVAVSAGMRASKSNYDDPREDRKTLFSIIASPKNTRGGQRIRKEVEHYSGRIYCVSVPSKMLVVRRNGAVMVCGNTEHSVTTSWGPENEKEFYQNILKVHGGIECPGAPGPARQQGVDRKPVSVVIDTYDQDEAIRMWLTPASMGGLLDDLIASDMRLVLRPDSGDPIINVLHVLDLVGSLVGFTVNEKGFRILPDFVRVIQGDGINEDSLRRILQRITYHTWSADNLVFGSGGGLLVHDAERDTHRFAMKTSYVVIGGKERSVQKMVKTDTSKASKKGRFAVVLPKMSRDLQTIAEHDLDTGEYNYLRDVWYNGHMVNPVTFEEVRALARQQISY